VRAKLRQFARVVGWRGGFWGEGKYDDDSLKQLANYFEVIAKKCRELASQFKEDQSKQKPYIQGKHPWED
jgi:hypothetical protein